MPRPKKTPEPAKRGPGPAPKPAPPKAERVHLRLTQEQRAIADRRAARRGAGTTLTTLALEGLLGVDETAELKAWGLGYEQGRAEERAAILAAVGPVGFRALPRPPMSDVAKAIETKVAAEMERRLAHIITDDPHRAAEKESK